jgi:hypothetical protein
VRRPFLYKLDTGISVQLHASISEALLLAVTIWLPIYVMDVFSIYADICCVRSAGGKILLSNTRLWLKRGRRYGLCGPNGSGKVRCTACCLMQLIFSYRHLVFW